MSRYTSLHSARTPRPAGDESAALLVRHAPYAIFELDSLGRLSSMNPAGLALAGLRDEREALGLAFTDTVDQHDRVRCAELLRAALRGESAEFELTTREGRALWASLEPLPRRAGSDARVLGIAQDVGARDEPGAQLLQRRRLDDIERRASGIAHDFNNLLTIVVGCAGELRGHVDPDYEADVTAILEAAERASELTNQLRSLAHRPSAELARDDEGPEHAAAGTVLLVEDDELVRRVAARTLRAVGHRVLEAESAEAALERYEHRVDELDLLLTDVVLPGLDGRQLATTLQARRPELPVLFTSGYTDDVVLAHGVSEREVNFLPKPWDPGTLRRRVLELLPPAGEAPATGAAIPAQAASA